MNNSFPENVIAACNDDIRLDSAIKRVLRLKVVLARIIKDVIPELKSMSIEDIMPCIEYEAADIPVERYPSQEIVGLSTEDRTAGEGNINYDIRFLVHLPTSGTNICDVIVDVEPQATYNTKYSLVKRAMYYLSRMSSAQLPNLSDQRVYDDLKKVYTIWICYNVPKKYCGSLTEVKMAQTQTVGNFVLKQEDYDLFHAAFFMIDEEPPVDDTDKDALKFLSLLLSNQVDKSKKLSRLKEYIPTDNKFEEEVSNMYGFANVYRQQGEIFGEARGMADGLLLGGLKMLVSLVRKSKLPLSDAASEAKMTEEEFKILMDEYPEEDG